MTNTPVLSFLFHPLLVLFLRSFLISQLGRAFRFPFSQTLFFSTQFRTSPPPRNKPSLSKSELSFFNSFSNQILTTSPFEKVDERGVGAIWDYLFACHGFHFARPAISKGQEKKKKYINEDNLTFYLAE